MPPNNSHPIRSVIVRGFGDGSGFGVNPQGSIRRGP